MLTRWNKMSSSSVVPVVLWGSTPPSHCISCIITTYDQKTIVTGSSDGQLGVWDLRFAEDGGIKVRTTWKTDLFLIFLIIKLLYFVLCLLKYIASNSIWQFWMLVDVLLNCVAWLEAHSISTFYIPKYKLKWNSLSIFAADHPKEPNFCPRSKSDSTCKSYWWMGQSVKYHQCCWQWVRLASVADTALN